VTGIGDAAFTGCNELTGIWVDGNNPAYCSDLNGVLYNKDKTVLVAAPFKLSGSFTIPSTVKSIGGWAFYECRDLTDITIPDGVTSIGEEAFLGCRKLTSITIPDSVTDIGDEAFLGCLRLTSIVIPDGVVSIGDRAFFECYSMTGITIPDSVTSIGWNAFHKCASLTRIDYAGTKAQWNAIAKDPTWNDSTAAYVIYCTDGNLQK